MFMCDRPTIRAFHLAAAACLLAMAGPASAVNWDHAFALQSSGGIVNPAVLVGFNPQPEPPASVTELSFDYPPDPVLLLRDQRNPPGGMQMFDVFLALGVPAVQFMFTDPALPRTGGSTVHTRATSLGGDVAFDVFFDISSSSGGMIDPGSLVGFNPQPEPPASFGGAFGMSFGIDMLSDAMVGVRVTDANGNALTLRGVPEPAGLALAGLGILAFVRRRCATPSESGRSRKPGYC
jgi:hypothetical protein